jgi:hypothetical protein
MRSTTVGQVLGFSLSALLGGCVLSMDSGTPPVEPDDRGGQGVVPDPGDTSTRGQLSRARTLTVQPGGQATLTATRLWGDDYVVDATVPFLGGEIAVQAQPDGRLTVVSAELQVGDVEMSPLSVPPDGLELTQVTLRVPYVTADAKWTADGSAASAQVMTELVLDWSLVSGPGEIHPMATQHIRDVPLSLDVVADAGGRLHAVVSAQREGIFFTWTGLFELSDLELSVDALE